MQSTKDVHGGTYDRSIAYTLHAHAKQCYLRAHLVKFTSSRADVFIPALSERSKYSTLPARGAFVRSFTPADLLQFARPLPTEDAKDQTLADDLIKQTNFREVVWPQHWAAATRLRAELDTPLVERENQEHLWKVFASLRRDPTSQSSEDWPMNSKVLSSDNLRVHWPDKSLKLLLYDICYPPTLHSRRSPPSPTYDVEECTEYERFYIQRD